MSAEVDDVTGEYDDSDDIRLGVVVCLVVSLDSDDVAIIRDDPDIVSLDVACVELSVENDDVTGLRDDSDVIRLVVLVYLNLSAEIDDVNRDCDDSDVIWLGLSVDIDDFNGICDDPDVILPDILTCVELCIVDVMGICDVICLEPVSPEVDDTSRVWENTDVIRLGLVACLVLAAENDDVTGTCDESDVIRSLSVAEVTSR